MRYIYVIIVQYYMYIHYYYSSLVLTISQSVIDRTIRLLKYIIKHKYNCNIMYNAYNIFFLCVAMYVHDQYMINPETDQRTFVQRLNHIATIIVNTSHKKFPIIANTSKNWEILVMFLYFYG